MAWVVIGRKPGGLGPGAKGAIGWHVSTRVASVTHQSRISHASVTHRLSRVPDAPDAPGCAARGAILAAARVAVRTAEIRTCRARRRRVRARPC